MEINCVGRRTRGQFQKRIEEFSLHRKRQRQQQQSADSGKTQSNQESGERNGQDSTYDNGAERFYHNVVVGKSNLDSKKKGNGQDCTYDNGAEERFYHDVEVDKSDLFSKKKRKVQGCTYDDGAVRNYHDLEAGKSNQKSGKIRKDQDCSYNDGAEAERKKASLYLSLSSSSSEESTADSNDTEYKEEQSLTSGSQSDGLNSSSKDEKRSPIKKNISDGREESQEREDIRFFDNAKEKGESDCNVSKEGDLTSGKTGFRKKVMGLDFWSDDINRKDKGGGSSAKQWPARLRQRSVTNLKKKMLKSGSICNPVCLDDSDYSSGHEKSSVKDKTLEDDSSSSSSSEDSKDSGHVTKKNGRSKKSSVKDKTLEDDSSSSSSSSEDSKDSGHVTKKNGRSKKIVKQGKNKAGAPKGLDFMNILVDSIWEEGDPLGEKLHPVKENAPVEATIQRKFRFQCENSMSVEKDESEKETDRLFADLQMGLIEMEIGSTNVHTERDDGVDVTRMTIAERCKLGYHQPILFEHIGMVCKYCKDVLNEIHNMFPEMKNRIRERGEWMRFRKSNSTFKGFEFDESGCENHQAAANGTGSVLNLIPPSMRRSMYVHQRDGFEFLWKNMAGDTLIEKLETTLQHGGTGCVISHAPGTGKSFLTIVFIMTFMNVYPNCRPVIVAPRSMLLTWAAEFRKWGVNIPFHNLNDTDLSGQENVMAASFLQQLGTDKGARDYIRMVKLYSWTKERSVLGVGYHLIEKLANHKNQVLQEKFKKILLEMPGLVVLDEGHTPRNDQSLMWKHLTKIVTGRRIILSGTPFQNNFNELHNILTLVNPGFDKQLVLNSGREDRKKRGRKSRKGKSIAWDSLASSIDKHSPITVTQKMKSTIDSNAVEKIKSMIDPFVHVHKGSILQEHLQGLRDTLIVLRPSVEQLQLLEKIKGAADKLEYLEKSFLTSNVSVHPSVPSHKLFEDSKERLEKLKYNPDAGVKTKFLFEVIRLSIAQGEKVLVFSQYLDPLTFISNLLTSYFSWGEGKELLVMHGSTKDGDRQSMINCFNDDKSESKVLLASIKACSEGINLVGASRVILLDVVWNPSVERQAICRAYRLGQKKVVHVYRLIMSETLEMDMYKRQVKKDLLSDMVFSSKEGEVHKHEASSRVLDDKILDAIVNHPNMSDMFEKILSQPKEANLYEDC